MFLTCFYDATNTQAQYTFILRSLNIRSIFYGLRSVQFLNRFSSHTIIKSSISTNLHFIEPQNAFSYSPQIDEAKEKNLNAFMSNIKDKNKRVVTRARSLARSLIDTICNCTNNVSNPLQQAATRLRRQQTAYERSSSTPRQQTRFED